MQSELDQFVDKNIIDLAHRLTYTQDLSFNLKDMDFIESQGMTGLIAEKLEQNKAADTKDHFITLRGKTLAAEELLRKKELNHVLNRLAPFKPLLLKGTALAYKNYHNPSHRMRLDTDLWIKKDHMDDVIPVMEDLGYKLHETSGFDSQVIYFKQEPLAQFEHIFDIHWEVSTWQPFAELFCFEEQYKASVPIPELGPAARGLSQPYALLHACAHPAMHHQNEQRLIWLYDVKLLLDTMSLPELKAFIKICKDKQCAGITYQGIYLAKTLFNAKISKAHLDKLKKLSFRREKLSTYISNNSSWIKRILIDLKSRPAKERIQRIQKILFPPSSYMREKYGLNGGIGSFFLPIFYLYRIAVGFIKMLFGS